MADEDVAVREGVSALQQGERSFDVVLVVGVFGGAEGRGGFGRRVLGEVRVWA